MKPSTTSKNKKTILNISAVAFWILVWEALAVFINSELIIASPIQVVKKLASMVGDLSVWRSTLFSLSRIALGFVSALVLGTAAAICSARFKAVKALLAPITAVIKSTPVASFVILAIIWFGSKNLSIFISFLMVFPVIYLNLLSGIENLDKNLSEMADVYKISAVKRFIYIHTVQIMPFLISACSLGLGLCWKSGVAAEVIGISTGSIGERLYQAKLYFETSELLAWTVIIIAVSVSIEKLVIFLLKSVYTRIEKSYNREYVQKLLDSEPTSNTRRPITPCAIKTENIIKAFGEQTVINGLTLTISPKDKLSIRGHSGAGKTTLLRIIMGLEAPDKGTVTGSNGNAFGVVFQEDRLIESLNPVANICVAGCQSVAEAVSLLNSFGLTEEIIYKPCKELSGGEKRRAAIARALLCDCNTIVMDEPFKGIDKDTLYSQVLPAVKNALDDKTLILVTHDESEAAFLCDKEYCFEA